METLAIVVTLLFGAATGVVSFFRRKKHFVVRGFRVEWFPQRLLRAPYKEPLIEALDLMRAYYNEQLKVQTSALSPTILQMRSPVKIQVTRNSLGPCHGDESDRCVVVGDYGNGVVRIPESAWIWEYVAHELWHWYLSHTFPGWTTAQHHVFIKKFMVWVRG